MHGSTTTRFVVATNPTLADELVGRVVAIRPLRRETVDTKLGQAEAIYSQVVEISDDGTPVDHGEAPIFWTVVRRQLAKATPESPWVVGRLVLDGQAYRLDPVDGDALAAAGRALDALAASN
jgi:hypothetical protein